MKTLKTRIRLQVILFLLVLMSCTDLEEIWYDKVTPDHFFNSKEDIAAVVSRPFTHASSYLGPLDSRWNLQEKVGDHFAQYTRGADGADGGVHLRQHYHTWTTEDNDVWQTWLSTLQGVALCLDSQNDLSQLDYTEFGLSAEDQQGDLTQLNTLIAFFYLYGLDYFGRMRRRTDLIRFGLFTTANWWDHQASNDASKNRYPVPTKAISGNNNLALEPTDE